MWSFGREVSLSWRLAYFSPFLLIYYPSLFVLISTGLPEAMPARRDDEAEARAVRQRVTSGRRGWEVRAMPGEAKAGPEARRQW